MQTQIKTGTGKVKIKIFILLFLTALLILPSGNVQAKEIPSSPVLANITVLDLQTAQKIALQNNPTIAEAMSRIEQAKARVDQAAAEWWPRLDISMSGSRTWVSDSMHERNLKMSHRDGQPAAQRRDEFSSSMQATWVLFAGFYRKFKRQQAEINKQTLTSVSQNSRRLIRVAVAESFLNAQLAQTNLNIARSDEEFYQHQLVDAKNRYEAGAGSWGDVLNIRVQLNSAKTGLIFFKQSVEVSKYGLAALMGINNAVLPQGMRLAALDKKQVISSKTGKNKSEELINQALSARPDIRSLELLLQESKAGQGMVRSRFYPKIQFVSAINGVRQEDLAFTNDDFSSRVQINASWNLFAGGADRARLLELRHKEREITHSLSSLRNQVISEVRQNLALLEAAREQVRLQRESVELVQENREMARSEYEAGVASLIRLNEAQRNLNKTWSRLAQALVSYHQARHRLLAATGENSNLFAGILNNKVKNNR